MIPVDSGQDYVSPEEKEAIQIILELKKEWVAAAATGDSKGMTQAANTAKTIYESLPDGLANTIRQSSVIQTKTILDNVVLRPVEITYVAPSTTPTISKGASGTAVKLAQERLKYHGYNPGTIDGVFGNDTYNAVIAFQTSEKLSPDGVIGTLTWNKLMADDVVIVINPIIITPDKTDKVTFKTIKIGSTGADVKYLQEELTVKGYATGYIDGIFGAKTLASLIQYQISRGLTADGVCGPETWAAINANLPEIEVPFTPIPEAFHIPGEMKYDWKYIIIHHTAANEKDTAQVRAYHLSKGWIDIGYNYVVEKSGKIVEGRSLLMAGAHCDADGMNKKAVGISVIGNYDEVMIKSMQYNSLLLITRQIMNYFKIPISNVLGHREVKGSDTACPGKYFNMQDFRLNLTEWKTPLLELAVEEYTESFNVTALNELDTENTLKGIHDILFGGVYSLLNI